MDLREAAQLRRLLEEMAAMPLDDFDIDKARLLLAEQGIAIDDATQATELWQRWQELQPAIHQAALDPEVEAFGFVDPTFQAAMDRLGERATDAEALAAESPGVRAIVTTRMIDGLVDNGGWVAIFVEGQTSLLAAAIDGYRLLGLDEHARLAGIAAERGHDPTADEDAEDAWWTRFEETWFDLPSSELARAAYLRAHPDDRQA